MEGREERGTVIDCSGGKARVRVERSEACQGCAACTLSDAGTFMICEAVDRLGVAPGDHVRIQTRGAGSLSAALLLFLVPRRFSLSATEPGPLPLRCWVSPAVLRPSGRWVRLSSSSAPSGCSPS